MLSSSSGESTKVIVVDNPYTGEVVAEIPLASSAEADRTVEAAAAAQREWAATTLDQRIEVCHAFLDALTGKKDELAAEISMQMGKPVGQAAGEVGGVVERTLAMIDLAPDVLATETPKNTVDGLERFIAKEPVGVVLCLAPWNYPLLTATNCVIPALLAGNSVVLKMSPRTPTLSTSAFKACFDAAGVPDGLVSPLNCSNGVVEQVIQHPKIGFVGFTGSVTGGHSVYRSVASSRFIDATLELGGKDPAYVAEDADVEAAVAGIVDGGFYNAGQSCCGLERVYVHSSVYEEFTQRAVEAVNAYTLGDPMADGTTMGPMAQPNAPEFLKEQVDEAVELGAQLCAGGAACHDDAGLGRFFQPTLLADCDHTMSVMMEESFGPVLALAAVDSDEEALGLMNDSHYGLTAAVFTSDADRVRRMGPKLEAGTVFMNRCDYLDPYLPWSGMKDTGKGVSLSSHGFNGVVRLKGYNMRV